MDINVKYFDDEMPELKQNVKGDWIDLTVVNAFVCVNEEDVIKAVIKERAVDIWNDVMSDIPRILFDEGDVIVMRLGVAIELPSDKKANVFARSSLFASHGLLLVNGVGCIDNIYQGDNDEWLAVMYCTRDGSIEQYERVVQFDMVDRMPNLNFIRNEILLGADRGGYGTSGKK